ncbi:PREDICTED: probable flavin-containing monooxygenase 1 [Fragaria vesca subsp. vesca]|uniref:probable flavin-containing monooxygenase 1 n=1 Tax=Fragaria vesca subsp. vesca TaxID=101020 RepID=UPI0002C339FD|nr:PREDICTED: probable flavin-containing monooxygenase 1 [Fragaria vesca subsp. vesca]
MAAQHLNQFQFHSVSKIGIIGAGISGIAAAKQLSGHSPVVFEATDSIGGVWKHCSYASTKLQTPRCDFEFSDYPWSERDNANFPSHVEVLEYLHGYATHFDLLKFVKFGSKVVEIRYVGDDHSTTTSTHSSENYTSGEYGNLLAGHPVWVVGVQSSNNPDSTIEWYGFEFIVVCIGKYGDIPRIPTFPRNKGQEVFKGKVMHSMDYSKLDQEAARELVKGKKVAVIGYKKSAIDLALECAEANQGPDGQPCTMVVRTLHWTVPSYWIWGLPFFLFYSTRSSQFVHERPNQSFLKALFCLFSSPMRKVVSKFIESYLLWKLPLVKYGLKPEHPFLEDYASCQMAILPDNFFPEADKGNLKFKRASKWWFYDGGVEFEDNTRLEADVVVLATGYDGKKKLQSVLPEPFRSLMLDSSGTMPLYRGTIHPLIPNMAFVGFIESVSNLHTAELRCKWLSRVVDNKFKLPSVKEMLDQISREMAVMKRTTRFYKRHCISTFSINHSDEICEEMGWKSWRKSNWLSEAFSPYNSRDYNEEKED